MDEKDIKINSLEINQNNMAEKLDDLKQTVVRGFEKIEERFECFVEDSDKKYANKNVEFVVYGMVAIILTSFIGGLIILVWK